jgi:hypothetical protein
MKKTNQGINLLLSLLALVTWSFLPPPVQAHGGRAVDDYFLVVGHKNEPAFAAVPNALDLSITRITGRDKPINAREGDTVDLEVSVQFCGHDNFNCGDQWVPLEPLRQARDAENRYYSDYMPTEPGVYAFRITGTIAEAQSEHEHEGNAEGAAQSEGDLENTASLELDEIFICAVAGFGCVAQPLAVPNSPSMPFFPNLPR